MGLAFFIDLTYKLMPFLCADSSTQDFKSLIPRMNTQIRPDSPDVTADGVDAASVTAGIVEGTLHSTEIDADVEGFNHSWGGVYGTEGAGWGASDGSYWGVRYA